jgi:hypothetical protein
MTSTAIWNIISGPTTGTGTPALLLLLLPTMQTETELDQITGTERMSGHRKRLIIVQIGDCHVPSSKPGASGRLQPQLGFLIMNTALATALSWTTSIGLAQQIIKCLFVREVQVVLGFIVSPA